MTSPDHLQNHASTPPDPPSDFPSFPETSETQSPSLHTTTDDTQQTPSTNTNIKPVTETSRGLSTHLDSPLSEEHEDLLFDLVAPREVESRKEEMISSARHERYRTNEKARESSHRHHHRRSHSWHWNHHMHESTMEFTLLLCVLLVAVITMTITLIACLINSLFVLKNRDMSIAFGVILGANALAALLTGLFVRRGTKRAFMSCWGWCFSLFR